jgi:predicted nuclease with TOPRIM domain
MGLLYIFGILIAFWLVEYIIVFIIKIITSIIDSIKILRDYPKIKKELTDKERELQNLNNEIASLNRYIAETRSVEELRNENSELSAKRSILKKSYLESTVTPFNKFVWKNFVYTDALVDYLISKPDKVDDIFNGMSLLKIDSLSCRIQGSSGKVYTTTLHSCTCEHYMFGNKPCKHMFYLAINFGALCLDNDKKSELRNYLSSYSSQYQELKKEVKSATSEKKSLETAISKLEEHARNYREKIETYESIKQEPEITFPWLSKLYADYYLLKTKKTADELRNKARPAIKASDELRISAREKHDLAEQLKNLEHKLMVYESIAPWLEDLADISPIDLADRIDSSAEPLSEYERIKNWLSPSEYNSLSNAEKYQLALDRYKKRNKSNWEIGIDYERFIGYKYESEGYRVIFNGALMGFGDLGRDLIASTNSQTLIIQCKRWSEHKTIHEKHICQLYGSVVEYKIQHPNENVKGIFVSTCPLSDMAKRFAEYLDIEIKNIEYDEYPLIKCNVNKTSGEKIYHLPFDQQYDRVAIDTLRGECYAFTIDEAENLGFRRAQKHHVGD